MRNKINQGGKLKEWERRREKAEEEKYRFNNRTLSSAPQGQICPFEVGSDLMEFFNLHQGKGIFFVVADRCFPQLCQLFQTHHRNDEQINTWRGREKL